MPVDEWQAQQERFARMEARIATLEGALERIIQNAPDDLDLSHGDGGYEAGEIARQALASTPQPSESARDKLAAKVERQALVHPYKSQARCDLLDTAGMIRGLAPQPSEGEEGTDGPK